MWIIYAVGAALVWGLDYSLTEKIFQSKISPFTIIAAQMFIAPLLFLAVGVNTHLRKDVSNIISHSSLLWMVIFVIITFNVGNFLMFLSIRGKNATVAGLIELCYPIFTALFTLILFKENHISVPVVIGAALILIGAGIVSYFA